jgi:hypothetical protein
MVTCFFGSLKKNGNENQLVGGFKPSEKYEFVNWDYYSQYDAKVIKIHGSSHHQPDIDP